MTEFLYRYESNRTCSADEFCEVVSSRVVLRCDKYSIIKRTPKGAWINYFGSKSYKKFVLLTAKKKFACETKKDALDSFIYRKNRHIKLLMNRVNDAKQAIIMADFEYKSIRKENG